MKKNYFFLIFILISFIGTAQNNAFITKWEVGNNTPGLDITIPTTGTGYNYTVDFGDSTVLTNQTGDASHTYASPGTYTVSITGDFPRIYFDGSTTVTARKIKSVEQWGDIQWQSMAGAFSFCRYLSINATDTPDLSQVTDMSEMFKNAYGFNSNINNWDVSNVTDMSKVFASTTALGMHFNQPLNNWDVVNVTDMNAMFAKNSYFNQALDNWDVSNVTNMERMFYFNTDFNQPLNNWDVSNVTNMKEMLHLSDSFNQSLDNWDVSSVTDMSSLFHGAGDFNQDLNSWDVSNVTDMQFMFSGASNFNYPLNNWDVSNVTNMKNMFHGADSFNQNINAWDVSNVTDMTGMFAGASVFNQPLNNWNVANVTSMGDELGYIFGYGGMFEAADAFNQDLSNWDVSNVENFGSMFAFADAFNQDLSNWDVSSATTMAKMFDLAISFNQPVNSWDVSNVTNMSNMFGRNPAFNQPLSNWDVSSVTDMTRMFFEATTFNQDISGWDVANVEFMGGMFADASAFNQDISTWLFNTNLSFDVYNDVGFLENAGLDVQNYDLLLAQFASLNLTNKELGADGLEYCDITSRNQLITNLGWVINGDTPSANCTTPIDPFITTLEVTAGDLSITIPTNNSSGYYNYKVDFGDSTVLTNQTGDASHTYASPGTYTVSITGDFPRIYFSNSGMQAKLKSVEQWGDIQWHSMAWAFKGCDYLVLNATDTPDLSLVTDMTGMFAEASGFNSGNLNSWDVSTVTHMSQLFREAYSFNQPLNAWNVSDVTEAQAMFEDAYSFNQPLSNWDVSNVTNMAAMFKNANTFNQPIDSWNVANVTDMSDMFRGANNFNQTLNSWDVSNVTDMNYMFYGASTFNQALANWDVSNVELMRAMFRNATAFNQDLSAWNFNQNALFNYLSLGFLDNCGLDVHHYDALLAQFASLNLTNKSLGANGLEYCDTNTRNQLITNLNWTIEDDSLFVDCNLFSPDAFITTWEVDVTNGLNISIPTTGTGYQYNIDFGDGTALGSQTGDASHTYDSPGVYTVRITGDFPRIYFYNSGMEEKLQTIEQWGTIEWQSMENAFNGCTSLIINATDAPDFSQVTDMSWMFSQCESLNQPLNHWDVSNVTNISFLFNGATIFNQDLSNWDVSNVSDMSRMFGLAEAFNQPLNNWNVSSVTNMTGLFWGADSFNQPLTMWDVSNVTNMQGMFGFTETFNQAIDNWDVSSVTNMSGMFIGTTAFNQPLNTWNVSNVTNMDGMFEGAISFNQPLDNWNVSNVLDMGVMFGGASSFNQDLSTWNFNNNINHFYETFSNSGLDVDNYDAVLQRFVQLGITNKVLGAHGLFYCDEVSHDELTNNLGWDIMEDDISPNCEMNLTNNALNEWHLFPNPTKNYVYLKNTQEKQAYKIELFNAQGQLLKPITPTTTRLNLSELASGIYFIKIQMPDGRQSIQKLVKE